MIEAAKSSRSSCRTCREKIPKGDLRFGEVDYTFDPDGSFKWHHLMCAAQKLPMEVEKSLGEFDGEVPDREALDEAIAKGRKANAFPRAEVAKTGRSKCMVCEEKIPKATIRVVVQREIERVGKRPGYMHPACAPKQVEDKANLLQDLKANSELSDEQVATLEAALA